MTAYAAPDAGKLPEQTKTSFTCHFSLLLVLSYEATKSTSSLLDIVDCY